MGTIICEDLSHEIWTIPNDAAVDIPATREWVERPQTVLSYMSWMGRMCRQQAVGVVEGVCVIEGGYMSLKGGCMLLLSSPSLFVAVSSIATSRWGVSSP